MKKELEAEDAMVKIVAPHGGTVKCSKNNKLEVDAALMTTESVLYDAIYIPGGRESIDALSKEAKALKFINEAFKHCKAIAADKEAEELLDATYVKDFKDDKAILINEEPKAFIDAVAQHRNWDREKEAAKIPV